MDSPVSTTVMARILGPFLIACALAVLIRIGQYEILFPAFFSNAPLVLVTGVFTFLFGLVGFVAHRRTDSLVAITVTLLVVACTLRGLMLIIAPEFAAALAHFVAVTQILPPVIGVALLLVGLWLTMTGWFGREA